MFSFKLFAVVLLLVTVVDARHSRRLHDETKIPKGFGSNSTTSSLPSSVSSISDEGERALDSKSSKSPKAQHRRSLDSKSSDSTFYPTSISTGAPSSISTSIPKGSKGNRD